MTTNDRRNKRTRVASSRSFPFLEELEFFWVGKMRWELKGSGDIDCMYDAVRLMNERDFFDGCVRDYLIIFRWEIGRAHV